MRFLGLLLNCPSAIPISHWFGVLFVLYSKLHVYNLHCQLPSHKNEQTWKGQRKILKARWANLWQNTSDDVLRGKILVSWAIQPVSYPTVPATHDAPLQRGMGERRLFRFLFPSFLFSSASLFFLLPTGVQDRLWAFKHIHCLQQTSGDKICGTLVHWGTLHLIKKRGQNFHISFPEDIIWRGSDIWLLNVCKISQNISVG